MLGVIISAITVIMLGYLMVGFAGYLAFPNTVEGNVLKSFPEKIILIQVWPPHFLCSPISQQLFSNISGRGPCMRMASVCVCSALWLLSISGSCQRQQLSPALSFAFMGLAKLPTKLAICCLHFFTHGKTFPTHLHSADLAETDSACCCYAHDCEVLCTAFQIARGVIGAVVTGHYPLNHHPARLAMEHLEQFCFGWKDISVAFSAFQSIIFIVSTIAVANVVRTWRCFSIVFFFLKGLCFALA